VCKFPFLCEYGRSRSSRFVWISSADSQAIHVKQITLQDLSHFSYHAEICCELRASSKVEGIHRVCQCPVHVLEDTSYQVKYPIHSLHPKSCSDLNQSKALNNGLLSHMATKMRSTSIVQSSWHAFWHHLPYLLAPIASTFRLVPASSSDLFATPSSDEGLEHPCPSALLVLQPSSPPIPQGEDIWLYPRLPKKLKPR
jgi:hypothetical protein